VRVGPFTTEPEPDDVLQVAGNAGLDAIKASLEAHGIDVESYSVVITLERGKSMATVLHLPGDPGEEYPMAAFETQLLHATATAKGLGLTLRVLPMMPGEG
jgi:hypothetical protein